MERTTNDESPLIINAAIENKISNKETHKLLEELQKGQQLPIHGGWWIVKTDGNIIDII